MLLILFLVVQVTTQIDPEFWLLHLNSRIKENQIGVWETKPCRPYKGYYRLSFDLSFVDFA